MRNKKLAVFTTVFCTITLCGGPASLAEDESHTHEFERLVDEFARTLPPLVCEDARITGLSGLTAADCETAMQAISTSCSMQLSALEPTLQLDSDDDEDRRAMKSFGLAYVACLQASILLRDGASDHRPSDDESSGS